MKCRILWALLMAVLLISTSCRADVAAPTADDTQETRYLVEFTPQNRVCVELPYFGSENEPLNTSLCTFAEEYLQVLCGKVLSLSVSGVSVDADVQGNHTGYSIAVRSRVTYVSERVVSVVFEGVLNHKTAAHPIHLFFTFNADPVTAEQWRFADRYTVDESLYELYLEYAGVTVYEQERQQEFDLSKEYTYDRFADTLQEGVSDGVYITPDSVGFSCPVAHALGDHLEAEIPWEALRT